MTPRVHSLDELAREAIRHSLDENLLVEAAAGTGKTTELVARIVRVLATGRARIDQVVAVTFTHKAAGELKLRLRQELDRARNGAADAERRSLEDALERLEEAAIGTIHSFCAQLLRERPVEARIDPAFEELAEMESTRLYDRAFRAWLEHGLAEDSPGLRRALVRLAWRDDWDDAPPVEQLQFAGRKLVDWRDFRAPWQRPDFDRKTEIEVLMGRVKELARLSARPRRPNDGLFQALEPVRELSAAKRLSLDTQESRLLKLARALKRDKRKGAGMYAEEISRQDLLDRRDALVRDIGAFQINADAELASELRTEMQGLLDRYEDLKQRSGKLDFVDLLIRARDLVRDNAAVRAYLQQRFTRIFVDEFQDTDPLQAEILLLLAADDPCETAWLSARPAPGKLFLVGDPKQSIYKFRRADVVLYHQVRDALAGRGVRVLHLAKSFRAVRPIQECVNAAFEPEMRADTATGQAGYVHLLEHAEAQPGQPCVIALPVPRPYGTWHAPNKKAVNACLPVAMVAFVEWLLNKSGWSVRENGDWVPLKSRHVCILFRRLINFGADLSRDYTRALEARGIPHLLVGSKSFHRREEVETVRAALSAVEWPDDELSVYAALRGTLFALPDHLLLEFRAAHGRLHPFGNHEGGGPIEQALRLLADLHRARNYRPVADTVNLLLEATRAHAGFALRPAGQQVLANVRHIGDLARAFEASGGISFRGFVEELESQAARAESPEAPVLEEGADGVRLMTVHAAKGLEFPVVILADMTANIAQEHPERYLDARAGLCATRLLKCAPLELNEHEAEEYEREKAEGVRVAYVAATRARDLLVVPVVGDGEMDGWVSPLNKAVYPEKAAYRNAAPPPGCPGFGASSVLERPGEFLGEKEFSVKPGLHRAARGAHDVVWWDPAALRIEVEENFGLRQEHILAETPGDGGMGAYRAWGAARESAIAAGSRPEHEIIVASHTGPAPYECPVEVASTAAPRRVSGRRFGTLVHNILRDAGDLEKLARMHARLLGATAEEAEAAIESARRALEHPIFARARAAARCHREFPVVLKLDGGRMLEGVIDLAFVENGEWHIVDFKTDADTATRRLPYEQQMRWYGLALHRLTGMPVRAALLSV